jgi:predicted dehydrogenase
LRIERAYADYHELLEDPEIDIVHNTTPSNLHFEINLAAIDAGKHIVSDKPLSLTPEHCAQLRDAAQAAQLVNAVTFNYRGHSLVQQARHMLGVGQLGQVTYIQGQYLQDWMSDPNVYTWRMDPEKGGVSSALADIGSHWCDLAQHISGAKITAVLADLNTAIPTRYKPASGSTGTFSKGQDLEERIPVTMHGEDVASVLLRFSNGARGCMRVGQVFPGHKNDLELEINGLERSLLWRQEAANELWIGNHQGPNEIIPKDAALMAPEVAKYARLPAGHQEGWADAFYTVVSDIYRWVRAGGGAANKPELVCDFAQAYGVCCVIDAMLRSNAAGGVWQAVERDSVPVQV